jgi:HlyD family secretion protein
VTRRSTSWFTIALAVAAGAAVIEIVRMLTSADPLIPSSRDFTRAERTAKEVQRSELRGLPPPEGQWIGGNGVVEPGQGETRVAATVAGRVAQILVAEGQVVTVGQPVLELESATEQAALAVAEAEVEIASAELLGLMAGSRREQVQAALAHAKAAKARSYQAAMDLRQLEAAGPQGGVSAAALSQAKTEAQAARAEYDEAEARRQEAVQGARQEEIRIAEARRLAAEARRDEAHTRLVQRTVTAPASGTVLVVKIRAGEHANPAGEPLLLLGDLEHLAVRVDIDERDIARVRQGGEARVRASSHPNLEARGEVVDIGHRMGRRNVRSDDPAERVDTRILEVTVQLEPSAPFKVGERVMAFLEAAPPLSPAAH